jgi:nicotinate-nucleotide adenylyltransferase
MSIAERAFEQFDLDGVVFIPTGYPVRKSKTGFSAAEDRCTMLKMAVAGNEHFDISHIEVDREGATYTIDTLRTLQTRYGDKVKLFFITGEDSTRDLSTWKDAPEIAQLVEVLSAPRTIPKADESTIVHNVSSFIVHTIQTPLIDIASSELREWVRLGHSLRYLVPEVVCDYIRQQGLYQR